MTQIIEALTLFIIAFFQLSLLACKNQGSQIDDVLNINLAAATLFVSCLLLHFIRCEGVVFAQDDEFLIIVK
jgi:hypothetical protein